MPHHYWTDSAHIKPLSLSPFFLEGNCDWMIKTIPEITKSNQVWTSASCRYVDHLEYMLDGVGICPNTAEQIRPKQRN